MSNKSKSSSNWKIELAVSKDHMERTDEGGLQLIEQKAFSMKFHADERGVHIQYD